MRTSSNYGFKLPEGTDNVKRQDLVDNFESIDVKMKAIESTGIPYGGTTTGVANTYAIATPTITALTVGLPISLKFNIASTGASTLNWCGLGAKGIKKPNGTDATNLKTGIYTLRYDGTNFILQGEGASGNATASDLLPGKTASTDLGDIEGTMPTKAAATYTPSTLAQTISALQYLLGPQTIAGDANLISANIRAGASIFGVAGNSNVIDTSVGTAVAADILAGKTACVDGVAVTGTATAKAAATITPSTVNQTLASGLHLTGIQTIAGDADLVAANIVKTANIFNVQGTALACLAGQVTFVDVTTYTSTNPFRITLGFTPSMVVFFYRGSGYFGNVNTQIAAIGVWHTGMTEDSYYVLLWKSGTTYKHTVYFKVNGNTISCYANFDMLNTPFDWIAYA